MIAKKLALALTVGFLIAGCNAPTNTSKQTSKNNPQTLPIQTTQTQQEKPPSESVETQEGDLELSVKKMKAFMASNLKDVKASGKTPVVVDDISLSAINIARGTFQNLNYMTSGTAFFQKKGAQYYAVFDTDFTTPNGPDLKVYLTKNSAATQRSDIKEGLDLGALKSLNGKQVYAIPSGTKIEDFHSISIHCKAFNVPWSYAALKNL